MWDYDSIKEAAKERRLKVTDLIALAPQNDPFYVGQPSQVKHGEWFADLWNRFGYLNGVHIRRMHYQLISQETPVVLPNGTPYENTDECWKTLSQAAKVARYLNLVNAAAFVDRRNPAAQSFAANAADDPAVDVTSLDWVDLEMPDMPALPAYTLAGFEGRQRYHLEIWCEKSTMNDILLPIARQYGAVLQTGVGELSITATLEAVTERFARHERPARVFYISDFDPAGLSMPVAVARKMEFWLQEHDDLDVSLSALVLTPEQCRHYNLPRTPIKETERRASRFEERFGAGATELDALEALYPGELDRIVRRALDVYYDHDLARRVAIAKSSVLAELNRQRAAVIARWGSDLTDLNDRYSRLKAQFDAQFAELSQDIADVWHAIRDDLDAAMPDIDDYPVPEAEEVDETDAELYSSARDYLTQLGHYKAFQDRAA